MMSLEFLHDAPDVAFRQTIAELQSMNPKFDTGLFEVMSIDQIDTLLERLHRRERRIIDESPYGSWVVDPTFVQIKLLEDGLTNLREHIEILEESERLIPGFTYYNNVHQFGDRIEGQTCTYLGENRVSPHWIKFIDSVPIMKALEVVRHGDANDFRRIYVEIADGRPDGLTDIAIEHITESTDAALYEMEAYCNERWEGSWPWETQSPYKINRIIEEYKQMRQQTLYEMHQTLNGLLREFDQGGQEQFEIISMVRNMSENVQAMIEKFAKLAGDAMINLRAMVMTKSGDEGAMKVEHGLTQAVNNCADALARLKVQLDGLTSELDVPPTDLGAMGGDPGMGGGDPSMGGAGDPSMGGGDPSMGGDDPGADPNAPPGGAAPPGMPPGGAPPPGGGAAPPAMPPASPPERPRKSS
jgi:hypothetical protein